MIPIFKNPKFIFVINLLHLVSGVLVQYLVYDDLIRLGRMLCQI